MNKWLILSCIILLLVGAIVVYESSLTRFEQGRLVGFEQGKKAGHEECVKQKAKPEPTTKPLAFTRPVNPGGLP